MERHGRAATCGLSRITSSDKKCNPEARIVGIDISNGKRRGAWRDHCPSLRAAVIVMPDARCRGSARWLARAPSRRPPFMFPVFGCCRSPATCVVGPIQYISEQQHRPADHRNKRRSISSIPSSLITTRPRRPEIVQIIKAPQAARRGVHLAA